MCKIGILSDTHGLIRPEVVDALNGCDSIIHAGDIDRSEVIEALREIAPVYAVRGNADKDEWADDLPKSLLITLGGIRIYAIHNKKHIAEDLSDKDVVIYGHTHKYHEEYKNGQLSSLTFTSSQAANCCNDHQIYHGQDYIETDIYLQKAV